MRDVDLHVGQDMPELKPVETVPLLPQTTGAASLVEEAGTIRDGDHTTQQAHRWKPTTFSRGRMSRNMSISVLLKIYLTD